MERAIVSARAKREYVEAIDQRYRRAKRAEERQILDEFCHVADYHRKSASRLLTGPAPGAVRPARGGPPVRVATQRVPRWGLPPRAALCPQASGAG